MLFFGPFASLLIIPLPCAKKRIYKAIEEICRKSTWHGSSSRLAAVRVIFSLVYVCMYVLYHASWPNEKQYRPEIRHSYSHWLYLKRVFCFLEEITPTAASLDKLPCHVDFPHISSNALFLIFSQSQANFQVFVRSFPSPFSREQLQSELIFIINNISVSLCWKWRYSCCIFLV